MAADETNESLDTQPALAEAPTDAAPTLPPGHVLCRVTKRGHDKIYTGATKSAVTAAEGGATRFEGADLFLRHPYGAMIALPLSIAQAQEDNGYLEIQD